MEIVLSLRIGMNALLYAVHVYAVHAVTALEDMFSSP